MQGHGHRVTRVAATDDGIFSASFDSSLRHWSFDEAHQPAPQPVPVGRGLGGGGDQAQAMDADC